MFKTWMFLCALAAFGAWGCSDDDSGHGDADVTGDDGGAEDDGGGYVVLTDLAEGDDYYDAVAELAAWREAEVVAFHASIQEAAARLAELQPRFVAIVTTPDRIDLNIATEMLVLASGLDEDPFVDFAYGFITGATAGDALALVRRIRAAEAGELAEPRSLLHYSPIEGESYVVEHSLGWAPAYDSLTVYSGDQAYIVERMELFEGRTGIEYGGHGFYDGIEDGPSYAHVAEVNLEPAFLIGGACYTGVVGPYFLYYEGTVERHDAPPGTSFALAVLAAGATGLIAGLDGTHGLIAAEEFEYAVVGSGPAGEVVKHTYDDMVVGGNRGAMPVFPRLEDGEATPEEMTDPAMSNLLSGACRVLLGDPAFVPFAEETPPPMVVTSEEVVDGVDALAKILSTATMHLFFDLYNTDWDELAYGEKVTFTVPWPEGQAAPTAVTVVRAEVDGVETTPRQVFEPVVERWRGQTLVHVHINFVPGTLSGGSTAEIEVEVR